MSSDYYCYQADLFHDGDCESILEMLNDYAQDPMGGGEEISDFVKSNLIKKLRKRHESTHVFLVRHRGDNSEEKQSKIAKTEPAHEFFPTSASATTTINHQDEVCGLAICFDGFSTFYCQKLLNIHDFAVKYTHRRKGLGSMLLMEIDRFCRNAIEVNEEDGQQYPVYCKITLEVLEGNHPAKKLYQEHGFAAYELDPVMGKAMFWQKLL
jgi:ribosomal protein S18 acetylase RimI-like enzyme